LTAPAWRWRAALLAGWAAYALIAVWGSAAVPFHPDETTFIFMSRDFDLLFRQGQPAAVAWQDTSQPESVRRYRLLDAPLSRYLAGLGRSLAGRPYLPVDWDWSASWEQNAAAGAVPDPLTLAAARLPAALLTGLSLGLVYALGGQMGGRPAGVTAALLYGMSGLVLLHGRRAMSEGPLLFFTLLTIWLLARPRPRLALAALALAAAVASKLTALSLLPVALAATLLNAGEPLLARPAWLATLARRLAIFALVFGLSLWALHPSLWSAPLGGLQAMRGARSAFLSEQTAFVEAVAPYARLASPGLRGLALVYHVFLAPPAYADVGQYSAATAAAEARYAANPLNLGWHTSNLSLNFVLGGLVLGLALFGLLQAARYVWAGWRAPKNKSVTDLRPVGASAPVQGLLLVWTAATLLGLLTIAVPAQRYYITVVPIACLWAAAGLSALARPFWRAAQARESWATTP
jgi:4-amino-4-deoxy-L-arabinose transferase-like glycosyltransferase